MDLKQLAFGGKIYHVTPQIRKCILSIGAVENLLDDEIEQFLEQCQNNETDQEWITRLEQVVMKLKENIAGYVNQTTNQ